MSSIRVEPSAVNSRVAIIVVTFNSEISKLRSSLEAFNDRSWISVFVSDNSTDMEVRSSLTSLAQDLGFFYEYNNGNVGIGEAQNRAILRAREQGHEYALFLDDDSAISVEAISTLLNSFVSISASGRLVAAVGPVITDARSQESLIFRWQGSRLRQYSLPVGDSPIEVAFMLSSGSLTSFERLNEIGLMRADYFIDHVDLEWGLRAAARGYESFVIPAAFMTHSLGDTVASAGRGNTFVYSHASHKRGFYQSRNLLLLLGDVELAALKKVALLLRLMRSLARDLSNFHSWRKLPYQVLGIWHGIRGLRGPLDP